MTMHVAVAGWLLGPPSGANRRLLGLLEHLGPLLASGERITVLHRPDYAGPRVPGIAWHPIAIPAAPTWARVLAERRQLAKTLRQLGATVHDHGFLPLPPLPIATCLLVHDVRAADGATAWPRWFARAIVRRSCARASAVVAPSHWTAARLAALAPRTAAFVVANGVGPPHGAVGPLPRPLPISGYLLHVGHLEARKNIEVVIDALALLPRDGRPELWLAGRDAGALTALQARALGRDVVLHPLGVVDETTLAALYRHSRAVVVPSTYEGFGLPALEGLAHGQRVLVSDAGALPEVVGTCTKPLPCHDPSAWAHAIGEPAADAEAAEQARARAARFSWPRAAQEQLAIWRRITT